MSGRQTVRQEPPRDLRAAWAARPVVYSRRAWAFLLALDRLPWPWGEAIMARCFVARALVTIGQLRRALRWASAHRSTLSSRWALALASYSHRGRFVARSAFTGIRDVTALRNLTRLRGGERVVAAGRGAIFLGFHLGPPRPDLALRIAGHHVTWIGAVGTRVGGRRTAGAWPPAIQRLFEVSSEPETEEAAAWAPGTPARLRALHHGRRILSRGESIFITADGPGSAAFEVPLPGGRAHIRAGWLLLREITGAPVLPVLSHMEGDVQVVTVHPALPPLDADPRRDLEACREVIGALLREHVGRFPEQCYILAFPIERPEGAGGQDTAGVLADGDAAPAGLAARSTHG